MQRQDRTRARNGSASATPWLVMGGLAVAAGLGAAALALRPEASSEPDSAPGRTARKARFGGFAVTGRTVTIHRARDEIYAFWRDFANLPAFMENVIAAQQIGPDTTRWTLRAPLGQTVTVETRIVSDRPGEEIAWRSTEASQIETEGKVSFRDAPAGRGTEVEAIIAYKPPMGELGRLIGKLSGREPARQGRHELKRLKMLLETGEIATSRTRRDQS